MFYTHWRANTLPADLFWGPKWAEAFIRAQQPRGITEWLDEIWAEGGAVLDLDTRVLLFFGGEDIYGDIPLRRGFWSMMATPWEGWDVRWAHDGMVDLLRYVGDDIKMILDDGLSVSDGSPGLSPPHEPSWTDIVGAIRLERGNIRLFPLQGEVRDYLLHGASLLTAINDAGEAKINYAERSTSFPHGGFWIDQAQRTIEFWSAGTFTAAVERVGERWPRWDVTWHRDRYEFQLERCEGLLQFPVPSRNQTLTQVISMLLKESAAAGVGLMHDLMNGLLGEQIDPGHINPHALRDAHLIISADERREILAKSLQRIDAGGLLPPA